VPFVAKELGHARKAGTPRRMPQPKTLFTPRPGPRKGAAFGRGALRASEWGKAKGRSPVGSPDPMKEAGGAGRGRVKS
jgi:hypothetical protein